MQKIENNKLNKLQMSSSYSSFSAFAKDLQKRHKILMVATAEQAAERMGFVLLPAVCLSWRKRQKLGENRRIKLIESYYALLPNEVTALEKKKLIQYIEKEKNK